MSLETTVLVVDASEYMRNADYPPTRFEALRDATNTLAGFKVRFSVPAFCCYPRFASRG